MKVSWRNEDLEHGACTDLPSFLRRGLKGNILKRNVLISALPCLAHITKWMRRDEPFHSTPHFCWCSIRLSRKLQAGSCVLCMVSKHATFNFHWKSNTDSIRHPHEASYIFFYFVCHLQSQFLLFLTSFCHQTSDSCAWCSQQYFCLKPVSDPVLLWPSAICVAFFSPN